VSAWAIVLLAAGGVGSVPLVTGELTWLEPVSAPRDAVLEVTVEDVSRTDAPGRVVGRVTRSPPGDPPLAFEVPVEPGAVDERHRYVVRASIARSGRLLFTTTSAPPVLTRGAGPNAGTLVLSLIEDPRNPPDRMLINTYWKLTALRSAPAVAPGRQREAHVVLQADGQSIVGSGGCNRLTGTYRVEGEALTIETLATTEMACEEGMAQEERFLESLREVRRHRIRGDRLELLDEAGGVLARLFAIDLR
jgi:putative lipoprotein